VTGRACRWCLAPIAADANPRAVFCSTAHAQRHVSRRRYAPDDADGYGARLAADQTCQACGVVIPATAVVQGRKPRTICDGCHR
jgi:hypothetical protein